MNGMWKYLCFQFVHEAIVLNYLADMGKIWAGG